MLHSIQNSRILPLSFFFLFSISYPAATWATWLHVPLDKSAIRSNWGKSFSGANWNLYPVTETVSRLSNNTASFYQSHLVEGAWILFDIPQMSAVENAKTHFSSCTSFVSRTHLEPARKQWIQDALKKYFIFLFRFQWRQNSILNP